MITSIELLDICFPDNFQGDSRVVLAVSLWPEITYGELKDEIECTSNAADYGIEDWDGWEKALNDWFEGENLNELVPNIEDFEFSDDDADGPYAYFAIDQEENENSENYFSWEDLDAHEILEHYLTTALWSSLDDNDEPFDDNYSTDDVAESAKKEQLDEICDWLSYCDSEGTLENFLEQPYVVESTHHSAEAMLGHDFWLTRNGHGAGFWDRGLGELGEQLSEACKTFGSCDPYVGDDGLIYFQ